MKKFIAVLLSLMVTVTAFGFTSVENGPTYSLSDLDSASAYSNSILQYKDEYSDYYLVQNGNTEYTIVIPDDASSAENTAAQEILLIFYQATGIKLQSVKESSYSGNAAFYIGDTDYKNQCDAQFDAQTLGVSGFRIITIGKNVVIYGNTDEGTLYGTYSLLTDVVNFEAFTSNYFYVDQGVTEIKLKNYNVTDVPDIPIRLTSNNYLANDKTLAQRLRIVTMFDYFDSFGGELFHNTFKVLPKETYQKTHPNWYASNGYNLCYTARGNAAEYESLLNTVFEELKSFIISHPDCQNITFTHEDNQEWCKCDACTELIQEYGNANSVTVIYFTNDLRTRLDEWFEGDGAAYKKDINLIFFAYHATNKPPVKYNETLKTYEPIDQTVVLKDGVIPLFAESNNDYTHSYYEDECKTYAENYKGWHALCDKIIMWAHVMNFSYPYTIFDNFSSSPINYQFYYENGTDVLFEEASYAGTPTSFHTLRTWLFSKLSWDCTLNVNDLIDRFFELYFRDAKDEMLSFFNAYRQYANIQKDNGYGGSRVIFFLSTLSEDYWPFRTLIQWYDMLEKAIDKIEPLKTTDVNLYNNLYDNITAERISVIYPLLVIWDAKFSDEEIAKLRQEIYEDFTRLGYTISDDDYSKLGLDR